MNNAQRRFNLFDAIILLVPTALTATTLRAGPGLLAFLNRDGGVTYDLREWIQALEYGLALCGPGLAAFTASLLVLRLRRPRPARRRLWRQPGATALLGAASVLAIEALGSAALLGPTGWPAFEDLLWNHSAPLLQMAGAAVIGVWVTLAASGRWKSERSWIDRAGRAVGLAWLLVFLFSLGLHYRSEITGYLPFMQWYDRMAARQVLQRQMLEDHRERERSRIARFDDLHALREVFLAEKSEEQIRVIDRLLDEWHPREKIEIAEERKELDEFNQASQQSGRSP